VLWTERQAEALRRAAHAHGPRRLHIVIVAAFSGATGAAQPA